MLTVVAAFGNGINNPFVFDDLPNITSNPTIQAPFSLGRVLNPPPEAGIGGRPVVNLTLALNYAVSGSRPWSYHLLNIAIHALAALTVFGIVRRTLLSARLRERMGRAATGIGLAVALLWAAHPLQTQAVTYVIQRCESLMGLFFLLTLYGAIRGWEAAADGQRRNARRWHVGAIAACALGAGTKEVIAAAPFLVLAYDLLFVSSGIRTAIRRSRWLYGGLLAVLILLAIHVATSRLQMPDRSNIPFTAWSYALAETQVVLHYLRLSFWPAGLVLDYHWTAPSLQTAIPYILVIVALLALTALLAWRRSPAAYPLLWFFVILAPTSSILPIRDAAFEHRMYLSLAAPITLVVIGVYAALKRLSRRAAHEKMASADDAGRGARQATRVAVVLLAVAIGVLIVETRSRNRDYRSPLAIWSDTVAKRPDNPRAQVSLGVALQESGRTAEAYDHFLTAVKLEPRYVNARLNLGICLLQSGRAAEAVQHLEMAAREEPGNVSALVNLGVALGQLGRVDEGVRCLRRALRIAPDHAGVRFNLAVALLQQGAPAEAAEHLQATLRLEPQNELAREMLQSLRASESQQ